MTLKELQDKAKSHGFKIIHDKEYDTYTVRSLNRVRHEGGSYSYANYEANDIDNANEQLDYFIKMGQHGNVRKKRLF